MARTFIVCMTSLFLISWAFNGYSQNNLTVDECYMKFKQLANRYYKDGDFARSELYYDSLLCLKYSKFQADDFYNAACTASLAGDKEKAFTYLTNAARSYHYSDLRALDPTTINLLHQG